MMSTGNEFEVTEVGVFKPRIPFPEELTVGEVGFIVAGIKNVKDTRVGDTITDANRPATGAVARIPQNQSNGLLRDVSRRLRGLR